MTYTNNVPQASQTIAETQGPILGNFEYIDDTLQVEHQFNDGPNVGQDNGTHTKVSLPNQSDPVAIPTGCAGTTYANSGSLYWMNTGLVKHVVSGFVQQDPSFALTASFQSIITLPANCIGMVSFSTPNPGDVISFNFFSAGGTLYAGHIANNGSGNPTLATQASGLSLQVRVSAGVLFSTSYKLIYWPL